MKKYAIGIAMVLAAGAAFADNSHQKGNMALGFDTAESPMIIGKYMLSDSFALTAGAGYNTYSGDADGSELGVKAGVRYYLSPSDMSLFAGGHLGYGKNDVNGADLTKIELIGEFGAEYFLAKQFSVEGTVGLGFSTTDDNVANTTENRFGTSRAAIGFNYYF